MVSFGVVGPSFEMAELCLDSLLDLAPLAMQQVFSLLPVEDLCTCYGAVSQRWTRFIRSNVLSSRRGLVRDSTRHQW